MSDRQRDASPSLSVEEIHCLSLLAHGKDVNSIAGLRGSDKNEIERLLNAAEAKLGAKNRLQTVIRASKLGLLVDET